MDALRRGGNFRLDLEFFKVFENNLNVFLGYYRHFLFFNFRGEFLTHRKGGWAQNLDALPGERGISDFDFF